MEEEDGKTVNNLDGQRRPPMASSTEEGKQHVHHCTHILEETSVIFVSIYFLVLVLVFQLFFSFSFVLVFIIFRFSVSFSFANYFLVLVSF